MEEDLVYNNELNNIWIRGKCFESRAIKIHS